MEPDGARTIAERSRGTPRIANRLLRRVRDFAEVRAGGVITAEVADEALRREGVDARGLDRLDRAYLTTIATQYGGGPVGINAIAATLTEDVETLEDVVEPYLLKIGLVQRTASGRKTTPGRVAPPRARRARRRAAATAVIRAGFLQGLGAATVAVGGRDVWDPTRPQIRVLVSTDVRGAVPQVERDGTFAFGGKRWRGAPSTVRLDERRDGAGDVDRRRRVSAGRRPARGAAELADRRARSAGDRRAHLRAWRGGT